MKSKLIHWIVVWLGAIPGFAFAQHNYEFNNQGAEIYVTSGAEVYIRGDVTMEDATALLNNQGLLVVEGNLYSDNLFQQRGTGTVRLLNTHVNTNQRQFIEGSYAVRGGYSSVGVDDGSFYNLELGNTMGAVHLVGTGNVADVRNSVIFQASGSAVLNRLVTHDTTAIPANGSNYDAVFGIMTQTTSFTPLVNNTISDNGNSSAIDAGYVQGKLRRAISPMGGTYPFVMGLEPGGVTDARGVQYSRILFGINNYDVVTGYFEEGSSNAIPGGAEECFSYYFDYFGGTAHGEWKFADHLGTGFGSYEVGVWPQDASLPSRTAWLITQDDTIRGTSWMCGASPIGLTRSGFNGFESPSAFGVAGADVVLGPQLALDAQTPAPGLVNISWTIDNERNVKNYLLEERLPDGRFTDIDERAPESNDGHSHLYLLEALHSAPGNHIFRISAFTESGSVYTSPEVEVWIPGSMDLITAYPNPVGRERLTLDFGATLTTQATICLYDVLGKSVWEGKAEAGRSTCQVPMDNLSEGVWMLLVTTESGSTFLRVVKTGQ